MLGVTLLSLTMASGASAQFAYGYMRTYPGPVYDEDLPPISPRAVVHGLQDRGFTGIVRPRFDGRAYVVEVTSPAGNPVRLFVDARDGGVIGRERLDTPYYPSGRVARAAPGYGWTEDDMMPRRSARAPEVLLPPADIPLPRPTPRAEIDRAPRPSPRPSAPEAGTSGTNPDVRVGTKDESSRTEKARANAVQRRTAKLTAPTKPAVPGIPSAGAASGAATSEPISGAISEPKTAAVTPNAEPIPPMPAANRPTAVDKPAALGAAVGDSEEKPPVSAKLDGSDAGQGWQDPPASEAKRNVRVIDGAIVVPSGEAVAN